MTRKVNPFPILKTERLILRKMSADDKERIFLLRSDDMVNQYIDRPKTNSIDEAAVFITKINKGIDHDEWYYWAITLKDSPKLIGTICLWNFSEDRSIAEIGYELIPDHQGKGYMHEGVRTVIEYAFGTLGLTELEAYTQRENVSSSRLLEKNNFKIYPGKHDKNNPNNIIYRLTKYE